MRPLLLWPVAHPVQAMLAVVIVTIGLAAAIPWLRVDGSPDSLMVVGDPARAHYDAFLQRFGSDSVTLVVVKAGDVFTAPVLATVRRLSDALERLEDVSRVESLTTVRNLRGQGDTVDLSPLVDRSIPTDPEALARIRRDALGHRAVVGRLVSADARTTAVVVVGAPRPGDQKYDERLTASVDALIAAAARPGIVMYQFGQPLTNATLTRDIRQDMGTYLPLSVAVLFLLLLAEFRAVQGLVIPVVTGGLSVVWALGLMALFGLPLNILTAMVPAVLIVIGSAEDVHMIAEYHHHLREGDEKVAAIGKTLTTTAWPVIVTTGTTVVGFGSVATSTIPAQVHFGYASALGLTANFVVTMIVLPILLRVLPVPRRLAAPPPAPGATLWRLVDRLGRFNLRHRATILGVAVLLSAGSLVGWWGLKVDTDEAGLYPEGSVIRDRAVDLQRSLTGFSHFYLSVDTGRPDGITDPAVLRAMAQLQDFIGRRPGVDRTVSVVDHLRTMHRAMHRDDPAFDTVPPTREMVAQYLLTMEGRELARDVSFDNSAASISVRHHLTGTGPFADLLERVTAQAAATFPPGVRVEATGKAVLMRNAADSIAINEVVSLGTTFAAIGVIHGLFFRSLRVGLLSLIPDAVPVLMVYGVMGLLGIPLDVATALIATLAIGIAVDDTVHHVITYWRELRRHGDRRLAMMNTMQKQARPILYVSLALAAGFTVFGMSRFVPIVHFGLLSGFVMLIALAAELVLTPIVMYLGASFVGRARPWESG